MTDCSSSGVDVWSYLFLVNSAFSHCSVIATLVSIRTTIILALNSLIYAVIPEVTVPLTHKSFLLVGNQVTESHSLCSLLLFYYFGLLFLFPMILIYLRSSLRFVPTAIKRINYRLYFFSLNPKLNIKFDALFHSVLCRTFLLLTYSTSFTQSTLRNVLPEF